MTKDDYLIDTHEHEEYLEAKDGTQIFMRSWQPKQEIENILFAVEGQGSHSGSFRKMAMELSRQNISVFSIDLRGYGHTGKLGDEKDFHLVFEDIAMAVNTLQTRYPGVPISMLGLSMGVVMILNTFDQFPELEISKVVLLAGRVKGMETAGQMMRVLLFFLKSIIMRDVWFYTKPMLSEKFRQTELHQLMEEDELCAKRFSKDFMLQQAPFMSLKQIMRGAAKISMPALIVHGENDTLNHPDGSRQLAEAITSEKKLLMIPKMGHDFDNLFIYKGQGLKEPLTANASRVIEEVTSWLLAEK